MGFAGKLLFLLCVLAPSAFAWPPEVAPEFNFSNDAIDQAWLAQSNRFETSNKVSFQLQEKFKERVAERCEGCVITEVQDHYGERAYRVTLKSGWHFEITLDPGVIEVKSKPISMDQMGQAKKDLDNLVWAVAKDLKLTGQGAGHLNFGLASTFGDDALLFHNFVVDYFNNPGLSQGVLGYRDFANAPHPEELSRHQTKRLRKILREFNPKKHSQQYLAERIFKEVYFKSTHFADPQKYHAVNLSTVAKEGSPWPRLELRAIPMQRDSKHFELLANLFVARIEYLKKNPRKLAYHPENFREQTTFDNVKALYLYATESGLDWEEYRSLVSKDPAYQMALEGLDFYIEKGGMKPPPPITGCAEGFHSLNP